MRWHGRRVAVYAYAQPADMRKGFDGLSALVTQGLTRDPLSGDVFLFVSHDRVRTKVLHWDGTGLCVYAKRLERGRFARCAISVASSVIACTAWPSVWAEAPDTPVTLTVSELDLFLDGSTLVGRVSLAPPALTTCSLASDRRG